MSKLILLSLATLCLTVPSVAQEQTAPPLPVVQGQMIIETGDSLNGAPRVFSFSTPDGLASNVVFADSLNVSGRSDLFSLANNRQVQKEIELVDDQIHEIKKINEDFARRVQEHVSELTRGDVDREERRNIGKLIREMNAEKKEKMESVLLPHQFDRLRQIALQRQMKRSGESRTLASSEVVEALGISDEQQQRLKERAQELKAEMEAEIKRLKEKSRKALLEELTREQRQKLEEMLGDDFEMKPRNSRQQIRYHNPGSKK